MASAPAFTADESYWAKIAAQYDLPRGVIQLENGNWGVMSRPVLAAYERHEANGESQVARPTPDARTHYVSPDPRT